MDLKKKAVGGAFWSTASTATSVIISIFRLSILTRFLEKADFGLVAIVTLILGFTNLFADLGVTVSLFSKEHISKKEYSSLYWVTLLQGLGLYILLILLSPLIVQFYDQPILYYLIPLMGLDLIFSNAGRQFKVFLQKQLRFKKIALIEISTLLISLVVALLLAMKGFGVYSLVYSTLTASFLNALLIIVLSYKTHPLMLYINIKENKSFYRIGSYQMGAQILDYFAMNFDILLIGKLMTPTDLGVYNLIKQLVIRVLRFINPIISNISLPLLSKLRQDNDQLLKNYLRMLSIVGFANLFTFGILASISKELLHILYGSTYAHHYLILCFLCLWGSLSSYVGAASSIIPIFGRTDIGFKWTIFRVIVNPLFLYIGYIIDGFMGLVVAQAIFMILVYFIYFFVIIKPILKNINFYDYTSNIIKYFLSALLLFILIFSIRNFIGLDNINIYIVLSLIMVFFSSSYFLLNRKKLLELYRMIRK